MKENLNALEDWYANFKEYTKLSLKEAQDLYLQIQKEKDEVQKKNLREKLILGTQYLLYKNLKNSWLVYLPSNKFDIEDAIHFGCIAWIEWIEKGNLLKISNFSRFFSRDFFNQIVVSLCSENFSYGSILKIEKNTLFSLIDKYILWRKEKDSICFHDFLQIFPDVPNVSFFYVLFERVYELLEKTNIFEDKKKLISRQLNLLLPYLIEEIYYETYNFKDISNGATKQETSMEEVENKILIDRVRAIFDELEFSSMRNKQMLADLYDEMLLNYTEVGKKYGVSRAFVYFITDKTCSQIRWKYPYNRELKSIHEELELTR